MRKKNLRHKRGEAKKVSISNVHRTAVLFQDFDPPEREGKNFFPDPAEKPVWNKFHIGSCVERGTRNMEQDGGIDRATISCLT